MMKVIMYCDCNSRGGVLTYTASLGESLEKIGVHVAVVSHAPSNRMERHLCDELEDACSQFIQLPACTRVGNDARLLARTLETLAPDIYIPNYRQMPFAAGAMLAGSFDAIGICHVDNGIAFEPLSRYRGFLSKFVVATEATTDKLAQHLPGRESDIAYIPHGVRIPPECEPFTGGEIKLLYHGRLCETQKAASKLLEIARELQAMRVPFSMRLIGDGSGFTRYVEAASSIAGVSVEPSKPWSELCTIIQHSHVALLTSTYEGFCFSLAEAMAAGLPGVAFGIRGVIEDYLTDQNGVLIEQGDVKAAAAAIARLQRDPELWSRLSVRARETVTSRYSWAATAKQYADLFEATKRAPTQRSWHPLRPTWIPEGGRSVRSIIERLGKVAGAWN